MKIWDIAKTVGASVVREAVPGGSLIIEAVNAMLPEDKRLPQDATGKDIESAVESLPPDQRAAVYEKELDVQIAKTESWTAIQQTLNQADAAGASTRPAIAMMMAYIVSFAVIMLISVIAVAMISGDTDTIDSVADSWELILAILATPSVLLRSYFGMRTEEKKSRYAAAAGSPRTGALSDIIKAFRK